MLHYGSYTYAYFFWVLSTIKMKFGQILVYCMTHISNKFLAQCWSLETSSRPLMILLKWQYRTIWLFLIIDIHHFQMFFVNLSPPPTSPPNCSKNSGKLLPLVISINCQSLVTQWVVIQKIYSKMHPVSYANTYHDVRD